MISGIVRTLGLTCFLFSSGCGRERASEPADHREPVEVWIKKLRDPSEGPAVRMEAMQVLSRKASSSPEAVQAVAETLGDKGQMVRQTAVMSLKAMGSSAKSALPRLRKAAADDSDPMTRMAAKETVSYLETLP